MMPDIKARPGSEIASDPHFKPLTWGFARSEKDNVAFIRQMQSESNQKTS